MEGIVTAIIGVVGTLLGTILGWCLNIVSNRGKIRIYISSWSEKFLCYKLGVQTISNSQGETELFEYECSVDIYNSSSETKIIRDIKIDFYDGKRILFSSTPFDENTKRFASGRTIYDTIVSQNIPPHSVINLKMTAGVWIKESNLSELFNTKTIYLEYNNEKNKRKKVIVKRVNYNDYFDKSEVKNEQAEDGE